MAGIPVHTSSPISPSVPTKASAMNPGTLAAQHIPASAAPTTTSTQEENGTAQYGAPAVPRPTNNAAIRSNDIPAPTPTQPVPTSSTSSGPPPPPQPGTAPAPQNASHTRTLSSAISPRTTNPIAPYSPAPLPLHQTSGQLSTPIRSIPPASATSYQSPHDLSHPPGYIQNSRASFEDRSHLAESSGSPFSLSAPMSGNVTPRHSIGTGILNGEMYQETRPGEDERGMWDTAVSWAKAAGKKLSQTEEQVWKAVNGEK